MHEFLDRAPQRETESASISFGITLSWVACWGFGI